MGLLEVLKIRREKPLPPVLPNNGIPSVITGILKVEPGQIFSFTPAADLEVVPLEPTDDHPPHAGSGVLKTRFIWREVHAGRNPGGVFFLYTQGMDALVHTDKKPERRKIEIPQDYYDVKVLPTSEA